MEGSIPDRFRCQVQLHRQRPAVASLDGTVTYEGLDGLANRVARGLITRLGVGSDPVAIVAGQNHRLIAGILGILKTGRPYLPLSERWPADRLAVVLRDSGAALLLGESGRLASAGAADGICEVLELNPLLEEPDTDPPPIAIDPSAPASLYYTSGSTGRPKGVADSHRGILHNILRYTNTLGLCPEDRLTLLQGAHFSGASSSMFGALLNGACVCPLDVGGHTPGELADFLVRQRVTVYHSVPTIFRSVLADDRGFPDIRVIRLEGDQASHRDVELFRRHFSPPTVLVNGLGATEAGLIRQFVVDHTTPVGEGILPVGYPVLDMDVLLLDPSRRPVAPGESGEIAVRSRYLALGYWNRPDLTAAAFLDDGGPADHRIYLTGDLGRLRPDGCLDYLGRRDFRVKIRGQAVDLADVESELIRFPGVREAAVAPFTAGNGELELAAYLVADGVPPGAAELMAALERTLPPHALPARYVMMSALPLSENRKVDRSALPPPDDSRPETGLPFSAPASALESLLAVIWESVLDIRPVGTRDAWTALGGDSLRAVQMIEQVERALGRPVPLSVLVEARTIEQLAETILEGQPADLRAPVVRLNPGGRRAPFYFLHGDYRSDGLYCFAVARHLTPEQPMVLLPPAGLDGGQVPESVEAMAAYHLRVLQTVQPHGPYRLGGNCNGGLVAYEMARRLRKSGERVDRLVLVRASGRTIDLRVPDLLAWGIAASRLLPGGGDHPAWRRRLVEFKASWSKADGTERLRLIGQKIARLPRMIRPHNAGAGATGGSSPDQPWRDRLRDIYMDAARHYVPGRFDGTLILFWPEHDGETPDEARSWWQRVVRAVDLRVMPGDHLSYATAHAESFARMLSEVLA